MADEQTRDTPWRQGMVLDHSVATALKLTTQEEADHKIVVVVTHDCDLASDIAREPVVEVIVAQRIVKLGADANAKTARRLHLEFETDGGAVALEFQATGKVVIRKVQVFASSPRLNWSLSPDGLVILQRWLASRYIRAAFADEFQDRMKAKPGKLDKKIVQALEEPGGHILAVYFDVDGGTEQHRTGPADVYELQIALLYDSTLDESAAYKVAEKAARAIEDAFAAAFCATGVWKSIRLESCMAVSDSAMTIAQSRLLKQWPLDHMSLDADPQQPMLG